MKQEQPNFEVLSGEEIRHRYRMWGITAQEVEFDESDVPERLRPLIPRAREWGIGDDVLREDKLHAADPEVVRELKRVVQEYDRDLEAWFLSPEATAYPGPSDAYIAFSNLRIAADCLL